MLLCVTLCPKKVKILAAREKFKVLVIYTSSENPLMIRYYVQVCLDGLNFITISENLISPSLSFSKKHVCFAPLVLVIISWLSLKKKAIVKNGTYKFSKCNHCSREIQR